MPLTLKEVKEIYNSWGLESDVSDDLQDWHDDSLDLNRADDRELLSFAEFIVDDFTVEKGVYWLDWAITYLWHGKKTQSKISILEQIITKREKYNFAGMRDKSARVLGDIAEYPNKVLRSAIEQSVAQATDNDLDDPHFSAAAYGGYIMTATDFQTGIDAGRALLASGETPTVEKAEEIIAQWRKEHGKSLPPSP